jgi:hypothetical protein
VSQKREVETPLTRKTRSKKELNRRRSLKMEICEKAVQVGKESEIQNRLLCGVEL